METKTKRSTGRPKLQKDAVEETVVMEQPKAAPKKKRTIRRKEDVSLAVEYEITKGGGGADIGPIMREGVPGMGLKVDGSRYFWYHHTAADTIDKVDQDEFNRCIATMAVMAYVVADMEERLPR